MKIVTQDKGLTDEEKNILTGETIFPMTLADSMVENVIGQFSVPIGVAANFKVNGNDVFIPMATEEPSVIAATSNAARAAYDLGGFYTSSSGTIMRGQIQVLEISDPFGAKARIFENKEEILVNCNLKDPTLVKLGGGAKDLEVHLINTVRETMLVVHLLVDTKDAMGANAVNTMAEAVSLLLKGLQVEGLY